MFTGYVMLSFFFKILGKVTVKYFFNILGKVFVIAYLKEALKTNQLNGPITMIKNHFDKNPISINMFFSINFVTGL